MDTINSENTPTAEDLRIKIQQRIKEAPENWLEKVALIAGKSEATIKSYIYGNRGKKKHIAPVLMALNNVIEEFNTELTKELSK